MARESYDYYKELHSLNTSEFERDLTSGIEFFEVPSSSDPRRDYEELLNIIRNDALYRLPELTEPQRHLLKIALYRMSPLYQLICRNTRNLLRKYSARGMARIRVPERLLEDPIPIDFTPEERDLYNSVETRYVKPFYRDYAKAGLPVHGVGFILTIYRKRAASSWASVTKSFQRRREKLDEALANWGPDSIHLLFGSVALKDIIEQEEVEEGEEIEREGAMIDEDLSKPNQRIDLEMVREVVERERTVVEQLLDELEDLRQKGVDSKRDALISHLKSIMAERRGVLVFSQYKDTVDDIAESMFYEFGSSMAKYHGSGGEVWDGGRFKLVKKEDVKKRIENGDFRLLIATDAASEGLNLQMMDAVVNYDLPWNPMRIEQRIGRIDRVTQTSPTISIGVLVPRNTIEMDVYSRCVERLGMFKQALGPLQPILVESFIEDLVLGRDDIASGWDDIEDRWATAKEHALLFEEALSAQEFKGGWQERKDAERMALQHLLSEVGYIEDGGVWERAGHRISIEGIRDGCDWMTTLSHDRLFVALLSEMGQMPQELEREGLQYKVIESGGSMALAVKHSDGSVRLIKDLTDIAGENEEQVGTDWEAAIREVNAGETDRRVSFSRFRKEQSRVREKEWRKSVERDVIHPLLRLSEYNPDLCADTIILDPALTSLFLIYSEERDASKNSFLKTLRSVDTFKKSRGKPPSLEKIIKSAEELTVQGRGFQRDR
ncbi:MAG TPA: helicase-related protein, partial [Methanomassiliicoccales archaeon]|nr:helicase-related protein [Methanomassiliicoccales archaeon]